MIRKKSPARSDIRWFQIIACLVGIVVWHAGAAGAAGGVCESTDGAQLQQIADGVYVRQGQHGATFKTEQLANIGFIVGQQCVAVIDSGASVSEGEALRCAIEQLTELPVCYLIISHHHYDHSMGSLAFRDIDKLQLLAHENFSAALQHSAQYYRTELSTTAGQMLPAEQIVLADVTVATGQTLELDLGARKVQIRAHGVAHTNNDLSLFDSATGTLWLSDLMFLEHVPVLDSGVGSINGWLKEIDALIEAFADHPAVQRAVPGHGPVMVAWPDGMRDQSRYLTVLRDEIRATIADGGSMQQALDEAAQSERNQWQLFELHHRRTVNKAFVELEWE